MKIKPKHSKKNQKSCPVKHFYLALSYLHIAKYMHIYARASFRAPRARALF